MTRIPGVDVTGVTAAVQDTAPAPPAEAYYYTMIAHVCFERNDINCAQDAFSSALQYDPDSAYLHYQLCRLAIMQNDLQIAASSCRKALDADPDLTDARAMLGRMYVTMQRYGDAAAEYELLLRQLPDDEDVVCTLSALYTEMGEFQKALALLQKLLEKNSRSVAVYYHMGNVYSSMDNPDAAESSYRKALSIQQNFDAAQLALAALHERSGAFEHAAEQYYELLKAHPDDVRVRNRYAFMLVKTGKLDDAVHNYDLIRRSNQQYEEELSLKIGLIYYEQENWHGAADELQRVLAVDPGNDRALYYHGNASENAGAVADAKRSYLEVQPGSSFYSPARIQLAYLYTRENSPDHARALIRDALNRQPGDMSLYRFLASLYEHDGLYGEGIDVLRQALEQQPANDEIMFYLGVLYDKVGKFDECIHIMQQVLRINAAHADALNYIGYSYADRGIHLTRAEKLIKDALKIRPDDGYITDSLGWVYFKMGKYDKALRYLETAYALVHDDPVITEHLADACVKMNDFERAITLYKKALDLDPSKDEVRFKLKRLVGEAPIPPSTDTVAEP